MWFVLTSREDPKYDTELREISLQEGCIRCIDCIFIAPRYTDII